MLIVVQFLIIIKNAFFVVKIIVKKKQFLKIYKD